MSVTTQELVPPRGSITTDKRRFTRVFSVTQDSGVSTPLSISDVLALGGVSLPAWGDPHPDEPEQTCNSIVPVSDDGGFGYIVTFEYELGLAGLPANANDVLDRNADAYAGVGFPGGSITLWANDDPCRKKWTFEMSYERQTKERRSLVLVADDGTFDAAKPVDPNYNTAGAPFKGIIREDIYIPVLHFTKNCVNNFLNGAQILPIQGIAPLSQNTEQGACAYVGSVNSRQVRVANITIPPFGAVMKTFQLKRAYWGKFATPYWQVRVEILCPFVSDPKNGALIMVLQQGFNSLDKGFSRTPVLLDKDGKLLVPSSTVLPYYQRFLPSNIQDWNSIGLPQVV